MKIAVLSNVNLDLLIKSLEKRFEVFETEGYGQWISYALAHNPALVEFNPKVIFLIIDGNALLETSTSYEQGKSEIEQSLSYVRRLAENYRGSLIAVSTIDVIPQKICAAVDCGLSARWEADWQQGMKSITGTYAWVVPYDLKECIVREGRKTIYSEKMWYMGGIPYSVKSLPVFLDAISAFTERVNLVRKKVLIIDLDNTIWGGVIGEDGPDGIELSESLIGAAYRDTQKRIQEIGQTGILLAVVSKNNPEDVDMAFEKNHFMVLKKDDFVDIIANWEPKSANIQALAQKLNLGLDSFVFLDDNELEREQVRISLPDVSVAEFPHDIAALPKAVGDLYRQYFWCWRQTAEDKAKSQQYREERERKEVLAASTTVEEYLRSLNILIELGDVRDDQVERTIQLINKTNQFNTNTVRMDLQGFTKYRNTAGAHVYVACVSDRYGDSGLVAVLLIRRDGNTAYVDNFLMSCRVMGRQIENAILRAVEERLAQEDVKVLYSSFVPTAKNKPVQDLWERMGFYVAAESSIGTQYVLDLPAKQETLLKVEWK